MAYNANLYNPYSFPQQPVNGLVSITSEEGAKLYQLPPNSVSPPLFLESENTFFIKRTDGGGAATISKYTFDEAPMEQEGNSNYVTKDYLDKRIDEIMEAINGKHTVSEPEQQ